MEKSKETNLVNTGNNINKMAKSNNNWKNKKEKMDKNGKKWAKNEEKFIKKILKKRKLNKK